MNQFSQIQSLNGSEEQRLANREFLVRYSLLVNCGRICSSLWNLFLALPVDRLLFFSCIALQIILRIIRLIIQSNFNMGNHGSDFYISFDLATLSLRNTNIKYFWIDPNVNNKENQIYLKKMLEQKFNIDPFDQMQSFKVALNSIYYDKSIIRVLCSASLKEEDYTYLDNNPKVDRVFLFCGLKKKADDLMAKYKCIKQAAFAISEVMANFLQVESQDMQNILFYRPNELEKINNYCINYGSLIGDISREQGKTQFIAFIKKLYPESEFIKEYGSIYDLKVDGELKYIQSLSWGFKNNTYYSIVSKTLRLMQDPTKLAYVRLPVHDLYHAIAQSYASTAHKGLTVNLIISLNSIELEKLREKKDKFIMLVSFIKSSFKIAELRKNQYAFKVKIPAKSKPKICNGYFINGDKSVLFNIGSIFSIDKVNLEDNAFEMTYVEFEQTQQFSKEAEAVSLNKKYNDYIIKSMQGQSLALIKHGYLQKTILMYKDKIEKSKKAGKHLQQIYKYHFDIVNAYIESGKYHQADTYLNLLLMESNLFYQSCIEVYFGQIYFLKSDWKSFGKIIGAIQHSIKEFKAKGCTELHYKSWFLSSVDKINSKRYQEAIEELTELRSVMIEQFNEAYLFRSLGKLIQQKQASCLSHLGRYLQAKSTLVILYDNLVATQGQTKESEMIKAKIEKQSILYKEKAEKIEIQTKMAKITSKVPMARLRQKPLSPIKLNISKIDAYFAKYSLR